MFDRDELSRLDRLQRSLEALHPFARTFRISGKQRIGTEDVVDYIMSRALHHPWMLPREMTTDLSPAFLAAEITREEVFRRCVACTRPPSVCELSLGGNNGEQTLLTLYRRNKTFIINLPVLTRRLYKELPYEIQIEPIKYQAGTEVVRIWQELLVKNNQHKAMVAGGGGSNINAIIAGAQGTLEKTLGRYVQLRIKIKVGMKNRKRVEQIKDER
jgi:GTPase Era involved in 16S rRNA processing